jgi:hypothetical protein
MQISAKSYAIGDLLTNAKSLPDNLQSVGYPRRPHGNARLASGISAASASEDDWLVEEPIFPLDAHPLPFQQGINVFDVFDAAPLQCKAQKWGGKIEHNVVWAQGTTDIGG